MIPPVSERERRPCHYWADRKIRCIFYVNSEFGAECRPTQWPQSDHDIDEILRPVTCEMHFTREEMIELIDNHNRQEGQE